MEVLCISDYIFLTALYIFIIFLFVKDYKKRNNDEKKDILVEIKKPKVFLLVIGSAIAYGGIIVSSSLTTIIGFILTLLSLVIMLFNTKSRKEFVKFSILSALAITYIFYFYIN